jgi:hypothetical protein
MCFDTKHLMDTLNTYLNSFWPLNNHNSIFLTPSYIYFRLQITEQIKIILDIRWTQEEPKPTWRNRFWHLEIRFEI